MNRHFINVDFFSRMLYIFFVLLKFVNDIEVIKNICYFIKMEG